MGFDHIYQDCFSDVFHYLCGLTGDHHLAEELTQETFFKALKALDQYDGRKDIRAWLFTIGRNTFYSHCRKRGRAVSWEELRETPSEVSISDELMDREQAFLIHQFLHTMAEPYKEVFTLRVFGELPYDRIATLFGKTPSWARVTYYRAKEKIVAYLKEVDQHDPDL